MAGRGGNTFLICWGVEGRRRNGQVGAERVWDGRAERDRSYFVLFLLLFSYSTTGGYEWRRFGGWVGGWRGGLFCWGVEGRRRNGQVGAERVWDGRAERDRIYFVLLEKFCFEKFDFFFILFFKIFFRVLFCCGVEGRRRNGQVGAERVWDGRAKRDRSYFVLLEKFCFEKLDLVFFNFVFKFFL